MELTGLIGFGTAVPAFTPASIPGLALWLDADDAATLFQLSGGTTPATANDDPVGYWGDKSGNGRHATQATGGSRPLLKTAAVNGRNAVLPDATDDYLALASALSLGTGAYTLYAVATRANATSLFPLVANNLPVTVFFDNNVYYTSDSGSLSLAYTGSTGAIALRVRRAAGGAVTFAATGQAAASMGTLGGAMAAQHVGGRPSAGQWQDGTNKLCEILAYAAEVTGTDDSNVLSYLSAKWGTSIP